MHYVYALVLPYYWGVDVSVRWSCCKAAAQLGHHPARSYRRIRLLIQPIPLHDIIFIYNVPNRAGNAFVLYTLFFCAIDGSQTLNSPHGIQECRPPTTLSRQFSISRAIRQTNALKVNQRLYFNVLEKSRSSRYIISSRGSRNSIGQHLFWIVNKTQTVLLCVRLF